MPIKNQEKLLFLMEKNTGFLGFFIFKKLNFYKSLKLKTAERWFFFNIAKCFTTFVSVLNLKQSFLFMQKDFF